MVAPPPARIGIAGTGFIGRQIVRSLVRTRDLNPVRIYSRRQHDRLLEFPLKERLTHSLDQLVAESDLIVECSGDPRFATEVVQAAFGKGLPVVTMNTEFHVTCGSHFVPRGYITEAEGDQPGSLAALAAEAVAMGFLPKVYGNMKGYLNLEPTPEAMQHWSKKLGVSLQQVTAFTDGTKLQMEQALVANGLGAVLLRPGMLGLPGANRTEAAQQLGRLAIELGSPVSDYLLGSGLPPGVFVTALHDDAEKGPLKHYKMGEGPLYVLERPFHLCGLEVPKTIRNVLHGLPPLLDNGARPHINVVAVAKRNLPRGHRIARGIGGFDLRGEAVNSIEASGCVPLGIVLDAVVLAPVEAGARLSWKDLELPDSAAFRIAQALFP